MYQKAVIIRDYIAFQNLYWIEVAQYAANSRTCDICRSLCLVTGQLNIALMMEAIISSETSVSI
jgi:hypothetical protein